jgi:hypothetical protein
MQLRHGDNLGKGFSKIVPMAKLDIDILGGHAWRHIFMACSNAFEKLFFFWVPMNI